MPTYTTVGTNRLEEALAFYDAVLATAGYAPLMPHGSGGRVYADAGSMFAVVRPFDGAPATAGNGTMIGFALDTRDQVDLFHRTAIAAGGRDDGAPGLRGPQEAQGYMTYVRDPDGNKICAYKIG